MSDIGELSPGKKSNVPMDVFLRLARSIASQFDGKDIEECLHGKNIASDDLKREIQVCLDSFFDSDILQKLPDGETIESIQLKIKSCLFLKDDFPISNHYGIKTFIAMCYYQKQSGLTVTGFPDIETLETLNGKEFRLDQNTLVNLKYRGIYTSNQFRYSTIPERILAKRLLELGCIEFLPQIEELKKKESSYMSVLIMLAQNYDMHHTGDRKNNIFLAKIREYQQIIDSFEESVWLDDVGEIDKKIKGRSDFFDSLKLLEITNTKGKKYSPFKALIGWYKGKLEQGDTSVALDFSYDVLNTHYFLRNYLLSKSSFHFFGFSTGELNNIFSGKTQTLSGTISGTLDIGGIKIPFPPGEFITKNLQRLYHESEAFLGIIDPDFIKRGLFEAIIKNIDIKKLQIPEGTEAQELKVMLEKCIYKIHLTGNEWIPAHRDQSFTEGVGNTLKGFDFLKQIGTQTIENIYLQKTISPIDTDPKDTVPINLFVPGLLCNAGYLEQFGTELSKIGIGGIHFSEQPAYKTLYDIDYQARRVVKQLITLHTSYPNRDINLIGHSLGTQVCFKALQILQSDSKHQVLVEKIKKCVVLAPVLGRVPMASIGELPGIKMIPNSISQINDPKTILRPGDKMGDIDIHYVSFIHDKLVPKYFEGIPSKKVQFYPGDHVTFLENGHRENIAQIVGNVLKLKDRSIPQGRDSII